MSNLIYAIPYMRRKGYPSHFYPNQSYYTYNRSNSFQKISIERSAILIGLSGAGKYRRQLGTGMRLTGEEFFILDKGGPCQRALRPRCGMWSNRRYQHATTFMQISSPIDYYSVIIRSWIFMQIPIFANATKETLP